MVQQAQPDNVLKHFQELSSATKKLAETDIPRSVLPDLISLGDKMHGGSTIRSLAFVPPIIHTGNPDYAKIRRLVRTRWPRPRRSRAPRPLRRRRPRPRRSVGRAEAARRRASASSSPVDASPPAAGIGSVPVDELSSPPGRSATGRAVRLAGPAGPPRACRCGRWPAAVPGAG